MTHEWAEKFSFDEQTGKLTVNVLDETLLHADQIVNVKIYQESLESEDPLKRQGVHDFDIKFISPCFMDVIENNSRPIEKVLYEINITGVSHFSPTFIHQNQELVNYGCPTQFSLLV